MLIQRYYKLWEQHNNLIYATASHLECATCFDMYRKFLKTIEELWESIFLSLLSLLENILLAGYIWHQYMKRKGHNKTLMLQKMQLDITWRPHTVQIMNGEMGGLVSPPFAEEQMITQAKYMLSFKHASYQGLHFKYVAVQ